MSSQSNTAGNVDLLHSVRSPRTSKLTPRDTLTSKRIGNGNSGRSDGTRWVFDDPPLGGGQSLWGVLGADCGKRMFEETHPDTKQRILPETGDPANMQWAIDMETAVYKHKLHTGEIRDDLSIADSATSTLRIRKQQQAEEHRTKELRAIKARPLPPPEECVGSGANDAFEVPPYHDPKYYVTKFTQRHIPTPVDKERLKRKEKAEETRQRKHRLLSMKKKLREEGDVLTAAEQSPSVLSPAESDTESTGSSSSARRILPGISVFDKKPEYVASLKPASQRLIEMQALIKMAVPLGPAAQGAGGNSKKGEAKEKATPAPASSPRIPRPPPPIAKGTGTSPAAVIPAVPAPPSSSKKDKELAPLVSTPRRRNESPGTPLTSELTERHAAGKISTPTQAERHAEWKEKYHMLKGALNEERHQRHVVEAAIDDLKRRRALDKRLSTALVDPLK